LLLGRLQAVSAPVALLGGRYHLLRPLGDEGETTAWEAHDTALQRLVVIKRLRPELAGDHGAAGRFRQQVRRAARGTSSDGPRVLDAGEDPASASLFVVLERQAADLERTAVLDGLPGDAAQDPSGRVAPARSLGWVHAREPRSASSGWRRTVAVLLAAGVLGAGGVFLWLRSNAHDNGAALPEPRAPAPTAAPNGAVRQELTPSVRQSSGPVPTPPPVATVVAGVRRRVANTDGQGVALRASPGGERLPGKGYDEGAVLTLLEQRGQWAHIRGDDGREGWVLAVTLVPE
jgi:hypothetical protein